MLVIKTLGVVATLVQATPAIGSVEQELFERSRAQVEARLELWSHRQQDGQLESVVNQMMRIAPQHPLVLEVAIYAALADKRQDDVNDLWRSLQRYAPNHIATLRVAERLQLTPELQQQISQIELYMFAGRFTEAKALLHNVYEEPPISLSHGILYWDVVARSESREAAIRGLQKLQTWYPDAPELRLALYSNKIALDSMTLTDLADLTSLTLSSVFGEQALGLWLRTLPTLPAQDRYIREVNVLAGYFPKHSEIERYRKLLIARYSQQRKRQDNGQVASVSRETSSSDEDVSVALPDPWQAFDRAVAQLEAGNLSQANAEMERLLTENKSTDARFAYALLLEKLDRDNEALPLVRQILIEDKGPGVTALYERLTARQASAAAEQENQFTSTVASQPEHFAERSDNISEQQKTFWFGYNLAARDSTPGISSLDAQTLMLRLSSTFGDDQENHWFIQVEPTTVSAGIADLDNSYWRPRFGTGLLCDSQCPTGSWPEAKDTGTAIGVGVEWNNWHADIGSSPIGFRGSEIVGSLGFDGDLGEFGWGIEVERRVRTSALVNFAGMVDPYSMREWGPVVETTLGGSFNWDQGTGWGWWSNFGSSHYGGSDVKSNQRWYAYTGLYKTFYDSEAFALDSGLTFLTWGYDNDQSQTTFGQGGYYSPKNYVSLSVPLSVYGRIGRFSYRVRASFGQSETRLHASEFFPNHPELQAEAEAIADITGIAPFFEGGEGGGFGRSLSAQLEYRLSNNWYIGGSALVERSEFYAPNNFTLYLRYDFSGAQRMPNRPPFPPQPYVTEPWWEY